MPTPIPPSDCRRSRSGWSVAAVFDVEEAQPWNVGSLAYVGASLEKIGFRLLCHLGEVEYSPADILRGNLPQGVTVLWAG